MEVRDTYKSIGERAGGLFKDRGSRFISLAYPVESESEVKEILSGLRNEYHDARHHCYAYRIGHLGEVYRSSDDGEPSGTAGRPILGQIDSAGLSDVLIVVVRYFGGIKLGVPGLINAYREAALDAIGHASIVEKTATRRYRLSFGYGSMNDVMKMIKEMDLPQRDQDFGLDCEMTVIVRLSLEEDFLRRAEPFCRIREI